MAVYRLLAATLLLVTAPLFAAPKSASTVPACRSDNALLQLAAQGRFDEIEKKLGQAIAEYEKGSLDENDARDALLQMPDAAQACHAPLFDAWTTAQPTSYVAALSRGEFLLNRAWDTLGASGAKELIAAQRASVQSFVQDARQEYQRSITLHPRPLFSYDRLISASKLMGDPTLSQQWLAEANKIAPKNTIARWTYMNALNPRWGGSYEKMWAVVEEVRTSGATPMKVSCFERDYALAWMEDGPQDADEVVEVFTMALKGPCRQAGDFYERGAAYYRLAAFDKAVSDFDDAVKLELNDKYKSNYVFWRGSSYEQLDQIDKAFDDFALAEKMGNAQGSLAMARIYLLGNARVARDPKKSLSICARVAKSDTTGEAFRCLASHYADGLGVARDVKKSVQLLGKAASMGDNVSKIFYGDYLWSGEIVQRDRPTAVKLWCEAARDDSNDADERLARHVGIDSNAMPHWSCEEMAKFSVSAN